MPRPGRYAGIEDGACLKMDARLRIALAFPDTYEVAMSYLGHKILYGIINRHRGWWAERAVAPEKEAARILRERSAPLCTLESDTPLAQLDCIAFAITHELCYTNVLYMLDLAGVPLRHEQRGQNLAVCPLVIAGGGALLGAEPLTAFIDLMLLGDGEESLPEALALLEEAKKKGWTRLQYLERARFIPGAYVPSFFRLAENGCIEPLHADHARPARRIMADLDQAEYPARQVVPIGAVHNRISLEIARGCTRGCRFCHAGMVYRPARERSLEAIPGLVKKSIAETGFDELSLLSLSTGDFSGLRTLCDSVIGQCASEQVSLCLPSLRVGSIDDAIMQRMSHIRRTGMTLAPEAGSQRLRDIINKGVTEEELILHAQKLLQYGWRQVKLYFMIGLPGETDQDLQAIADLCRRVRDAAGAGAQRMQVTAAISPFVPKPFTPFQWEKQIDPKEIIRRVDLLRQAFRGQKFLKLHWHKPEQSYLEGILSRGGRELADVLETAYRKDAIFCSWMESFRLEPWLEALESHGLAPESYLAGRDPASTLPWDHLEAGISKEFLLRERARAQKAIVSPDCRYGPCHMCGACDMPGRPSLLPHVGKGNAGGNLLHRNRLNFATRDQKNSRPARIDGGHGQKPKSSPTGIDPSFFVKACEYRIWHEKTGGCIWLSQLEMQSVLDRAMRRARLPLAFSRGFHPMPLLSFGRALPVGVESMCEWFAISLREFIDAHELPGRLNAYLPKGLSAFGADPAQGKNRTLRSGMERFSICCADAGLAAAAREAFRILMKKKEHMYVFQTKKGAKEMDVRPLVQEWNSENATDALTVTFTADWRINYLSPLKLLLAILELVGKGHADLPHIRLIKTEQLF